MRVRLAPLLLPFALARCADAPPAEADIPRTRLAPAMARATAATVPTLTPSTSDGVRAFPGAEGFGASATGGRGGRVIWVTTLASTGPGSLAAALAETGPRYVLFAVSGVIDASPYIAHGDVTIAGQTSPGGVIVRGIHTDEARFCDSTCGAGVVGVDNVVMRHLRLRPGPQDGNELIDGDALRIRHSRNVMIDHVSAENAIDEAIELSYSNHVTVQDSLLGETLGEHAVRGGMLMNYSNPAAGYALDAIAVIRTAWVRALGRYPEVSHESAAAAGSTMQLELSNNLLWDQRYYIDTGHRAGPASNPRGDAFYALNWVGNVSVARPSYRYAMLWFANPTGRSTVFFDDDVLSNRPDRTNWQLNYCCDDFADAPAPPRPAWARDVRHDHPAVQYLPSGDVRRYALAHAGAFPRDPMDRRLMGYVADGVALDDGVDANPARDTFARDPAPTAPADSDRDGMPDDWERAEGLDPMTDDHNGTAAGMRRGGVWAGYPNLEVWLHELAERRLTEGPWGR